MVDGLGHAVASWLLPANAWTAVLLAGALLLDRALARRARASLRIALYAPVALRVLVPFSWAIELSHLPRVSMLMPAELVTSPTSVAAGAGAAASAWSGVLAAVYLGVAAVLAFATLARRRKLARAVASASSPVDVAAPCPVVAHPELGPMVIGVLSPRIVLPRTLLAGEGHEALACVLRHEVAHVRRGDPWLSLGIDSLLVAFWPVLPLWIAATRVRHLVELACDEAALAGFDEPARRRYGHVLLDLAEEGSLVLAGAGSLHFGSRLRARIEAIALERPWPRAVQAVLVASAVAGFAACSSTAPPPSQATTPIAKQDEYGYKFEDDRFLHATPAERAAAVPPTPPESQAELHGRLAPEAIQAVVRQNFGRFRTCYEKALSRNKTLAGTVTVSFVINPDGSVRDASDNASTLPDPHVVQCVVEGFGRLTYPPPEGGYVTVVYPVVFSPGD
jgi:beta-lactamase regulating signal transducer with metallopeptidase domain